MSILLTIGIIVMGTAIYQSINYLFDMFINDQCVSRSDYPRIGLYTIIAICGVILLCVVSTNFLNCLTIK